MSNKYTANMQSTQNEQAKPNQVKNNAGGYVFALDNWKRLDRFLILGSDAPTYYASARTLTRDNAKIVEQCWLESPEATLGSIVGISREGRAPKNDAAIFALALGTLSTNEKARQAAYAGVIHVCRTATHLFMFVNMARDLGKGWGRGMKNAVAKWYTGKSVDDAAYQMIKYRQREGYTHKRLLQTAHPVSKDHDNLFKWITKGEIPPNAEGLPQVVANFLEAQNNSLPMDRVSSLPWEAFPTEMLKDPALWKALLPNMGLTAMIRNLGKMQSIGVLAPLSEEVKTVMARLRDQQNIQRSRVHPLQILTAMKVYSQGHGDKGSLSWTPDQLVVRALNDAFYLAFQNVQPTGQSYLLALDVSSSMTTVNIAGSPVNAREGAATMALVTATMEENVHIVGFSRPVGGSYYSGTNILPLAIRAGQSLDEAVGIMAEMPFGGTDCTAPLRYAIDNKIVVDKFVIYTDNETYGDKKHVFQYLQEYRKRFNPNAKMIVVGMTSTGFTIADPSDAGSLDVVGFDTATPALISGF